MPKIFVTNYNPDFSYEAAAELGELVYMTEGYIPPAHYASVQKKFLTFAQTANDDDMLLLSGANILTAIAVNAWTNVKNRVTVMQHTKRRGPEGRTESVYATFTLE